MILNKKTDESIYSSDRIKVYQMGVWGLDLGWSLFITSFWRFRRGESGLEKELAAVVWLCAVVTASKELLNREKMGFVTHLKLLELALLRCSMGIPLASTRTTEPVEEEMLPDWRRLCRGTFDSTASFASLLAPPATPALLPWRLCEALISCCSCACGWSSTVKAVLTLCSSAAAASALEIFFRVSIQKLCIRRVADWWKVLKVK